MGMFKFVNKLNSIFIIIMLSNYRQDVTKIYVLIHVIIILQ